MNKYKTLHCNSFFNTGMTKEPPTCIEDLNFQVAKKRVYTEAPYDSGMICIRASGFILASAQLVYYRGVWLENIARSYKCQEDCDLKGATSTTLM